jgi:hypothetical protein
MNQSFAPLTLRLLPADGRDPTPLGRAGTTRASSGATSSAGLIHEHQAAA